MVEKKKGHFKIKGSSGILTIPASVVKDQAFPLQNDYKVMVEIKEGVMVVSPLPRFEHTNTNDDHATIYDNKLARTANVYFHSDGVTWCDLCNAPSCEHRKYSLTLPEVLDAFKRKGIKIPNN
jgi:antitoxin component of MazEF toxin-antitoxin module